MTEVGRVVGLDVGDARIGVAVSDPLGITAQPREVIRRTNPEEDIRAVVKIAGEVNAVAIVAGLPLTMKGEVGHQAEKVLAFLEMLKQATPIEVTTQDERFSTASAERSLLQTDMRRKDRKKVVDQVAAHHILQTYMDRQARQRRSTQ